jgi:hypothetical protein
MAEFATDAGRSVIKLPEVTAIIMGHATHADGFTFFTIHVHWAGLEWSVDKRFKQFDALRKSLPATLCKALPPKQSYMSASKTSEQLDARRKCLQAFLHDLVNDDAREVDQNTTDHILEFLGLDESKVQERGAMLQTQQAAERQLEQERQRNRRERRAQEAAASQNAWGPKGSSPAPVGARAPPPPPPPSKGSRHTATQETSWERPAALLAPPVSPKQQRQHARLHWDTLHRRHGAAKLAADAFKVGKNRVTHSLIHSLTHSRTHVRTHARTHSLTHSVLP